MDPHALRLGFLVRLRALSFHTALLGDVILWSLTLDQLLSYVPPPAIVTAPLAVCDCDC